MELIIAEKPTSAQKIAFALAEGTPVRKTRARVSWFEFERGGKKIAVVPAAGHLYGLAPTQSGSGYPVLDGEWKPSFEIGKASGFTRAFLENISSLAKNADSFVAATDFDLEGETIAANVLEFCCRAPRAKRMKFSTLTNEELRDAYENALPSLDKGIVDAGRTRHYLDFAWGLSLSRALMSAIKNAGVFRIMSIGRVQGPALALVALHEEKIRAFVSQPYWQLTAFYGGAEFVHEKKRFFDESEADKAFARSKKDGVVSRMEKKGFLAPPHPPFDLTSLQMEASRLFGFTPARTLEVAQSLYLAALISYPRTSSQKLPKQLNLPKIISQLAQNKAFERLANALIQAKRFTPLEGKKEDKAHPAIFPTGLTPSRLSGDAAKVYDLVAKRFLSCFAPEAAREQCKIELALGSEKYCAEGERTKEKGWIEFYEPYARLEEKELPALREGQRITVDKIVKTRDDTKPPKRFTPASIVKELEEKNIGTKATRAEIVETLYRRDYIKEKSIEVTPLGETVFKTLRAHVPEIVGEELTRHFEEELGEIEDGTKEKEEVVEEGKRELQKICVKFRKDEAEIGKELLEALNETRREESVLGKCGKCGGDGDLVLRRSRYGLFVGCSNYPKCNNIFPLPKNALVKPTGKTCDKCGTPIVTVIRRGRRPFNMCLEPSCETKANWGKKKEAKEEAVAKVAKVEKAAKEPKDAKEKKERKVKRAKGEPKEKGEGNEGSH